MSRLNIENISSIVNKTKENKYNPPDIVNDDKSSLKIDIDNEDSIFTFICSDKNNKDNNKFLEIIYLLEEKVRKNIDNQNIENLSNIYSSFNFDINWIDRDYKNLIIKQISEDLITDNIIEILKKS